jgi:hypothetical protein
VFRAQIDALSDRHRCVSVEWPGHGVSGFAPGAELVWIDGAGHHSLVEEPGAVTAALEAFLARVAPAGAAA